MALLAEYPYLTLLQMAFMLWMAVGADPGQPPRVGRAPDREGVVRRGHPPPGGCPQARAKPRPGIVLAGREPRRRGPSGGGGAPSGRPDPPRPALVRSSRRGTATSG